MTPRRGLLAAGAIAGVAVTLAWLLRFGTDDAYITFVYARDLAHHHAITWFGTHVEGYTNFGWVLWIALGIVAGVDPLAWAWLGTLVALAGVIVLTYRIAALRSARPIAGLCAAAVLATNFTFLAFGTSGLETMLQTVLIAAAMWQVERLRREPPTAGRLLALSTLSALAMWTRLDSAIACAVLGAVAAHRLVTTRAGMRVWASAIVPVVVLVGSWLAWKLVYYGELLPNTFYVKAGTGTFAHGVGFVGAFVHAYMLWPLLALAVVVAAVRRTFVSRLPAAIVVAQVAYIVWVGGDFMEFRFFVPVLPMIAIVIAELVTADASPRVPSPTLRVIAVVVFLAAFSVRHAATFTEAADFSRDSIGEMGSFYEYVANNDWAPLGQSLHDVLGGTSATLATNGAGAIPYFSELSTVDQLGLSDAWIARHGVRPPASFQRPGHQRFASYDYLVRRGVTLVIGPPKLVTSRAFSSPEPAPAMLSWFTAILGPTVPPNGTFIIVGAPIYDDRYLLMWYLTADPTVTARLHAAGWPTRTLIWPPT